MLVEFRYGNPQSPSFQRFTNWTSDVEYLGQMYLSTPEMSVTLAQETGTLGEKPYEMSLPMNAFADRISDGRPHSKVWIKVVEQTQLDAAIENQILFSGRMSKTRRNAKGKTGLIVIEAENIKSMMDIALGGMATHQCIWLIGKKGCDLDIEPFTATGSIATINGAAITITGVTPKADRYWHRGYLQIDGLEIMIREWVQGTAFELVKKPPADWLNQVVKLYPGDDRTIETCRSRFNNESRWSGPGYAMPSWNPTIESP